MPFVTASLLTLGLSTYSIAGAEKQRSPSKVVVLKPVTDKGVTTGDFKGGLKPQDQEGKSPTVWVAQLVWWDVQQVLVQFDLSQLPKNLQ
ncbi:MAG: hypothetical protein RMK49_22335, partial [Abditibacteriales bacterium]|nr:hypothetical protein [Abditibacteriales bacterium]